MPSHYQMGTSQQQYSYYSQAKYAEQVEKDLPKAEYFYFLAVRNGEKLESAVKDLATVLHQQGKTVQACQFLEEHRALCKPSQQVKLDNLLSNLKKQLVPTGNYLNKTLVLFNVPSNYNVNTIKNLFSSVSRVQGIQFVESEQVDQILANYEPLQERWFPKPEVSVKRACLLHFTSNSGARKTLDTLKDDSFQFYWLNVYGKLVRRAEPYRKKENHSDQSSDKGEVCDFDGFTSKNCWNSYLFPSSFEQLNTNDCWVNDKSNSVFQQMAVKQMET
eukprot:CAMPEP_0114586060 /NCGR_PEP_ID=MMETSP0125-20121206/9399_1 /TAXON_ID=485358 ORGANISM="Aristerostoma sp., Strain ATCC 50986" /NCGR_SAMPLE_ID=MMETSP0125 /ASSEMBLY_ACC=CAM_ASM_000245 /LENGTH=274 /DNA_ID=CAMNT_0001781351 /DNA_START=1224 /DNA_END=2048 /DNA_ORIENTATION=+